MKISPFMKFGLLFSLIPIIATYILGHALKVMFLPDLESMDAMDFDDPDRVTIPPVEYIWPFAILGGLIALACWILLMRKNPSVKRGIFAGLTTVFMSYPILGFAIGFIYPDLPSRLTSAAAATFLLVLIGNMLTFWITYPLGALGGGIIGNRFVKAIRKRPMHEFD